MPDNIISTQGDVVAYPPGSHNPQALTYPPGITVFQARRMSGVYYRRTAHMHGKYSRGLVRFEGQLQLYAVGLETPIAPSAALGAAGAITGQIIYYVELRHKIGSLVVHRSNLSSGSNVVTATADRITVTLPTTSDIPAPDSTRATHWGIYRSDDGALPKEVTEVVVGTLTYSDNAAVGDLGDTPPLTASGLAVANRRGVPPYCRWARKWHNRLWLSGDPDHPYRTYYSEVDEFESFGEDNYVDTREGESTSGLGPCSDEQLIFCFTCAYELTGYRAADFVIRKAHPSLGCISHFSIVNYDDNKREKLLWASQRGVVQYDGGFKFVMEDMETWWKADFERHRGAYMNSQATEDWEEHWYKLLVVTPRTLVRHDLTFSGETGLPVFDSAGHAVFDEVPVEVNSWYYIGHYLRWHPSFIGGDPQMMWTLKLRARKDSAIGYLVDDEGTRVNYALGCDGYIRRENVPWDADDDGDAWQKRWRLRSGHAYSAVPGGDDQDGRTLDSIWLHLQAEEDRVLLEVWGGEDQAAEPDQDLVQPPPQEQHLFEAGGDEYEAVGASPPSVRRRKLGPVPGPGHTFQATVWGPRGVRFSGWGAVFQRGPDQRGADPTQS